MVNDADCRIYELENEMVSRKYKWKIMSVKVLPSNTMYNQSTCLEDSYYKKFENLVYCCTLKI